MSHTTTNVLIHYIFSTHHRTPFIKPEIESNLHAYLGGIMREIGGIALCINGMPDHVHLLVRMPSTQSVADVARLVKTNSSRWVHERWPEYECFAWQAGYGAFSIGQSGVSRVKAYIAQQEQHHHVKSFKEEFRSLLERYELAFDEKYLWT